MEAGQLTEKELKDFFERAGAKKRTTLTLDGFETLLDLLSPLTEAYDVEDDEEFLTESSNNSGNISSAIAEAVSGSS